MNKVIIIGAGINGLVAANYLVKNGFDVSVIEKKPYTGGACIKDTVEIGNKKIDFAAINLGAKSSVLFFKIHIPMLHASFIIAFLFVFIDILKELPATLILRPFNFNTLSILTFEYASSEQLKMAAVPSLLIMLFSLLPLIFIHLIFKVKKI